MYKIFKQSLLPLLACAAFGFALFNVLQAQQPPKPVHPPIEPSRSPYGKFVAGSGIVEPQTENISVGAPVSGVVTEVCVGVGTKVRAGDPLFRLDDRALKAELNLRTANLAAAEAQLTKTIAQPRPEELPASEAQVKQAEANLTELEDIWKRGKSLFEKKVVTQEDLVTKEGAYHIAAAQLAKAKADYALIKAGAWEPDKLIARTAVEQMRAQAEQTRTELDRLVIRALVDGEVLQVNVRPGEFVGVTQATAYMVIGNIEKLHVRADIDEHDIPRFLAGAPAHAMLRGNPQDHFPLTFVRVEPFVVPKKSLTGDNTERVDTRVLQVIYSVRSPKYKLYVGQQVDVFIDADTKVAAR